MEIAKGLGQYLSNLSAPEFGIPSLPYPVGNTAERFSTYFLLETPETKQIREVEISHIFDKSFGEIPAMAGALVNPPSPRNNPLVKRTSTPTLKNIGRTLAAEIGEIIDRLGENHPKLHAELLVYIGKLDQRHPEWRAPMERARQRLIGGRLGASRRD